MKKIIGLRHADEQHWVGEQLSPFLMLDYASPATFPPGANAKGVGPHSHRGFETVTIVFDGELGHKDSAGNSGQFGRLE
jgi:hypothetical protein